MRPIAIGIIDYGMGNLRSVANAFSVQDYAVIIIKKPKDLYLVTHIVLPGVGAFGDGMKNLRSGGWIEVLEEEVRQKGKPFLGLCLGMQLLATIGTEHGLHKGLDWISGRVSRIEIINNIRIPHIGWNDVRFLKHDGLYNHLGDSQTFYFVHSYILIPENDKGVSGITSYGIEFAASIENDNIFATQFHPEKSQKSGLTVLKNFVESTRTRLC